MLRSTLLLLLSSASFLPAAVQFSQPSAWLSNGDNVGSSWTSHLSSSATGFLAYDNFSLAAGGTINQVSWRGIYLDSGGAANGVPNTAAWGVSFYADNAGTPGGMLSTTTLTPAQVGTAVLGTGVFGATTVTVYEFTANVNAFQAAAGTTYWFSPISSAGNFNPFFSWIQGTGGDSNTYQQQFSAGALAGTFNQSGDRAFTLTQTPEPSTALFVLCGLAGVAAGRVRRRR